MGLTNRWPITEVSESLSAGNAVNKITEALSTFDRSILSDELDNSSTMIDGNRQQLAHTAISLHECQRPPNVHDANQTGRYAMYVVESWLCWR
jgi:hypothetical protein